MNTFPLVVVALTLSSIAAAIALMVWSEIRELRRRVNSLSRELPTANPDHPTHARSAEEDL